MMSAAEVQPDYRYDESRMLEGIRSWQGERKQWLRAAVVPTPPPVALRTAAVVEEKPWWGAVPAVKMPVVHFSSLPSAAREVCEMVCAEFDIPLNVLTSANNGWHVSKTRHIAFYLMVRVMGVGMAQTARLLGGFHHTTVLSGIRVVEERMRIDDVYASRVKWMAERLTFSANMKREK
jgi:hypothetical protein